MSDVISLRIDKELKEAMKKIPINWREEIEKFIKDRIRMYLKEKYLEEARKLRERIPQIEGSNAELIREDRDAR